MSYAMIRVITVRAIRSLLYFHDLCERNCDACETQSTLATINDLDTHAVSEFSVSNFTPVLHFRFRFPDLVMMSSYRQSLLDC